MSKVIQWKCFEQKSDLCRMLIYLIPKNISHLLELHLVPLTKSSIATTALYQNHWQQCWKVRLQQVSAWSSSFAFCSLYAGQSIPARIVRNGVRLFALFVTYVCFFWRELVSLWKGNRCGWYAVPNSSFVSQAVEVKNNSINDSFGGTK